MNLQALGRFFYIWKGLEIERVGFQHGECQASPPRPSAGIVNFLKSFKPFCQQGQRQTDPGDEVAERWPGRGLGENVGRAILEAKPWLPDPVLRLKEQDLGGT